VTAGLNARKTTDAKKIIPNETLFVVNFHEETTKKEDLEMLFSPHGQLVRIDMRKNYAFVQFTDVADATKAKEATNGGKLDQSVITVEYVAQRERRDGGSRDSRRDREEKYERSRRGRDEGRYERSRREDEYSRRRLEEEYHRRREERYDDYRGRGRSPHRDRYDDYRRARSRSRSPIYRYRSRSRSPPHHHRRSDHHRDDYRGEYRWSEYRGSSGGRSVYDDYPPPRGSSGGRGSSPLRSSGGGGASGGAGGGGAGGARSPSLGEYRMEARRPGEDREMAMAKRDPWP